MDSSLEIKNINKRFGDTRILENVNLSVPSGEFLVLVGPSGCGKSTLLRMIAGLEDPTEGEIWISGKNVTYRHPKDRHIAMVFQSYALYPHMNVFDNMAFGLRVRKRLEEEDIKKRVYEAAEMLQLTNYLHRKPKHLSGGQRQRVAVGRAIVRKPRIFLFDEPLSNLDAHLRTQMRVELKKMHGLLKNTMVYVTHDQVEATTMGDRIAILNQGVVQQVDTPVNLYWKPANRFVAGFIGVPEMNFVEGVWNESGLFQFAGNSSDSLAIQLERSPTSKKNVVLGIRPEFLTLADPGTAGANRLRGIVEVVENLGAQSLAHVKIGEASFRVLSPNTVLTRPQDQVAVAFEPERCHLFDRDSGEAI